MAVDALGRGYDPVALIDPATGLPVAISGGGGGGGSTGSVGAAGTNGTLAQSVQGITNGVPVPVSDATVATLLNGNLKASTLVQYNTSPVGPLANGGFAFSQADANGRAFAVPFVNGAVVSTANPMPVTGGGGSGVTDAVVTTYSITGAGAQTGLPSAGYGSALVEMQGAGTAVINLQTSSDSTDGVNGTWASVFGTTTDDIGADSSSITTTARRRVFEISAPWVRVNATSFSSAVTVYLTRKISPIRTRSVTLSGNTSTTLLSGVNVIGSTTIRATGTNRSATVGTTAANLMSANSARQGWKIKNDTAGDIWINFDTTATATPGGGNIKIPAGGYLASEPGFTETGAMSAIGSAAGLNITAREH